MGVSFDIPDVFDSIYGYGCENSLGAQEFCQMLHRVREPINKIIYLSMNLYKEFDEIEDKMTYESVEKILCSDYYLTHFELHNNLVPIKIKKIEVIDEVTDNIQYDRVLQYPYKTDPNYDLFVRNCWETIENKLNFSASFYGYAKCKEYKLLHFIYEDKCKELASAMKEIKSNRENVEKEMSVQGILDAPDISKDDFITLIKQKDEYLEEKDVQSIQRFRFRNCYKLDSDKVELNYDLIDEFNTKDKMKWYYNLINIMPTNNQTINDKLEIMKTNIITDKFINSCYLDFTSKNIYANHLFAINIINITGYDINDYEIKIVQSEIENNLIGCMHYIDSHKMEIAYKFGLKLYNKNITNLDIKEGIKIVNTIIFSQYGLKIKKITKTKKNQDTNDIFYQLIDDNIWDTLPKDNKIESIDLYDKEITSVHEIKKYDLSLLDFLQDDES